MADALFVSPTLIERYLGAARKISRLAIADASIRRMIDTYQMSGQLPQDGHFDELPLGTRGGLSSTAPSRSMVSTLSCSRLPGEASTTPVNRPNSSSSS